MFAEFPTQNAAEWREAITKILKGQSEEALHTPLYEGFSLQPFYSQEEKLPAMLGEEDFGVHHTCLNIVPVYTQNIAEDIIIAQEMIDKGADAVCYVVQKDNWDIAPYIKQTTIPFGVSIQTEEDYTLPTITDISDTWLFLEAPKVGKATFQDYPNPALKLLHIDLQTHEEAGANAVQTLAFGLNRLVAEIERVKAEGISAVEALTNVHIGASIGGNYFVEIAKLRALRILWRNILQAYQVPFTPLFIRACASNRNKMRQDRYTNLLRNTTEAMAGIIGGANTFTVLPYNSALSFFETDNDEVIFAQRIARNTLVLLKEEAHLDKVIDISAGSYYIEQLTHQLATRAWELFQNIEAQGGFDAAQATIQSQIAEIAQKRQADFEAGKQILVGVNRYQNPTE